MRLSRFSVVLLFVACGASEPERASRRECEQLRDHLVQLRMETVTADQAAHRAHVERALDPFVAGCTDTLPRSELACSLRAAGLATLAACSTGGAS